MPVVKKHDFNDSKSNIQIVHISDIHYDKMNKLFDNTVEKINSINPDILFITGDLVDNVEEIDNCIDCLSKLSDSFLKYAILGNWEYWANIDINDLSKKLLQINIKLLINKSEIININNREIYIYGVDDYLGGKYSFIEFQPNEKQNIIILAHCPILFDIMKNTDNVKNKEKILVLSGHTHGGQITFFGLPLFKPEGSGKYTSGIYKNNKWIMNVNKGLGNSTINMRLFSSPTIDVIFY